MKKLSILIPTMTSRADKLNRLLETLNSQPMVQECEILTYCDDGEKISGITTGRKRNELLQSATGKYSVFIDDDDMVRHDYIEKVIQATMDSPDCITFKGIITMNGKNPNEFIFRLGSDYTEKKAGTKIIYFRPPGHLCPIRTELARQIQYPDKTFAEDFQYCMDLQRSGIIQSEKYINEVLYYYQYIHKGLPPKKKCKNC